VIFNIRTPTTEAAALRRRWNASGTGEVTEEPEFLTVDEIPEIHRNQIERYRSAAGE